MSEQQHGAATDSGSSAGGSELTGDLPETCGLQKPVDKARPSPRQQDELHQAEKKHFCTRIMSYFTGNKKPWDFTGALGDEPQQAEYPAAQHHRRASRNNLWLRELNRRAEEYN